MTKTLDELDDFDPAEYLDNPEVIQTYLDDATETGDPQYIAECLGAIARAKGMSDLAKKTGLSRESLYKTLSRKGNPNLKTLLPIVEALGVHITLGKTTTAA